MTTRAHGREAVQTFLPKYYCLWPVCRSRADVVMTVAEDVVCRIGGFHVPGGFAQHHRHRLIVQPVRKARVTGMTPSGFLGPLDLLEK